MTARVLMDFACRLRGVVYAPGDAYEGTPERIAELAEAGYVEAPKAKSATRRNATRKAAARE